MTAPLRSALSRPPLLQAARPSARPFSTRAPLRSLRTRLGEIYGPEPAPPTNVHNGHSMQRYEQARRAYWWRRQRVGYAGMAFGMTGIAVCTWLLPQPATQKMEAAAAADGLPGSEPSGVGANLVRTGTDSVPFFPRTMRLARSDGSAAGAPSAALPAGTALGPAAAQDGGEELTLVGLGIRTVSFLSIQVYVVGLYVATADVAALQARMVKAGAEVEGASTLVGSEVEGLRARLLDPAGGLELWNALLREDGVRSVVRIAPTRNTDFGHLRDGWVTGMTARSGNFGAGVGGERFDDAGFGEAVAQFKAVLGGRKSLGKGRVLLLERERSGRLVGWEETGDLNKPRTDPTKVTAARFKQLGAVDDERVSRLIWLGYLGGSKVSSEGARAAIVDGVIDMVTRPVGTVEAQVV